MPDSSPSQHFIVLDDASHVVPALRRAPAGGTIFVPEAGADVRDRCSGLGVAVLTSTDLPVHEAEAESRKHANGLMARIWNLPVEGRTLSEVMRYLGVGLQAPAHAWLVTPLVESLTQLIALDMLWEIRRPASVLVAREPGTWGIAAVHLAEARGIPVTRIRSVPPRPPLWPPSKRFLTQFIPDSLRLNREIGAADAESNALQSRPYVPPNSAPTDILVPMHFGGEARAVVPIIRRLQAEGKYAVAAGADSWGQAAAAFEKAGIPFEVLNDAVDWAEAIPRVHAAHERLAKLWMEALASENARTISHRGASITALMEQRWSAFPRRSLRQDVLRQYLLWIELMEAAIEHWKPRALLIADEAMAFDIAGLRIAHKKGIPVLHVQHGSIVEHPKHRCGEADVITVGGDAVRRYLEELGTDPKRIVVTGFPQFDPLGDRERLASEPVRERLGLPEDRPLVLFTMLSGVGMTPREEVAAAIREVTRAFQHLGDRYAYVYKRHPSDRGDILSQLGINPEVFGAVATVDEPIHPLLMTADVVVTQMSTTGTEALLLDKPLVIVNLSGRPDTIPYVEYGAAIGVTSPGKTAHAVESVLTDGATRSSLAEGRERFVRDFAFGADGKATERIIGELDRLLSRSAPA